MKNLLKKKKKGRGWENLTFKGSSPKNNSKMYYRTLFRRKSNGILVFGSTYESAEEAYEKSRTGRLDSFELVGVMPIDEETYIFFNNKNKNR